jgi:hypothetical protein
MRKLRMELIWVETHQALWCSSAQPPSSVAIQVRLQHL